MALRFSLLALGFLSACARPSAPPAPALLLLTLDTTVPEALGAYGGPAGLTPNLDALARDGVVFEDARAVAPLTLPAHASILTGLYPVRHALRRNGERGLDESAHTLAELARARGYATAAFVSAVVLDPQFGLTQGFDTYAAPPTPAEVDEHLAASRPAHEIVAAARAWLAAHEPDRPFFLWLHFYDPHFPYRPPSEFLPRAEGDAYLGEIAAMDAALGTVLSELERRGRSDDTLVVALADHGESRGRHGEETHGAFVYESTLRIPFLARLPGRARAGERVSAPVSQVDVLPLVSGVLGWELDRAGDGRDPLGASASPGVYFESYFGTQSFGWSPLAGWTDGREKYVHSSAPELFDLVADPLETRNLAAERPGRVDELRTCIAELCKRPRLAARELTGEAGELQREIERLGYAGSAEEPLATELEPLATSGDPSPHRMRGAYADYMQGRKLYEEQAPREQALALLERAVRANPENHKAWFTLGLAELDLQRYERAAEAFRRVTTMRGSERIPAELNLAVCLYNLGRSAEALALLERTLADTSGPPGALELLVRLLEENGRPSDAARARLETRGQP